jgi:predicted RNA-binding Zn ribbon-like protein
MWRILALGRNEGALITMKSTMKPNQPPAFFVGGHFALDFLNTTAKPQGVLLDWLGDGNGLVGWLEQAGGIEPAAAATIGASDRDQLDDVARQARQFRNWLRGFVTSRMGRSLRATTAAMAPLNELLANRTCIQRLEVVGPDAKDGRGVMLRNVRCWESPQELLDPIAEAAADLICNEDFRYIRGCEGSACVLLFCDRTKAHARRWCSMAVCGNRAKAAAHRSRKKTK